MPIDNPAGINTETQSHYRHEDGTNIRIFPLDNEGARRCAKCTLVERGDGLVKREHNWLYTVLEQANKNSCITPLQKRTFIRLYGTRIDESKPEEEVKGKVVNIIKEIGNGQFTFTQLNKFIADCGLEKPKPTRKRMTVEMVVTASVEGESDILDVLTSPAGTIGVAVRDHLRAATELDIKNGKVKIKEISVGRAKTIQ